MGPKATRQQLVPFLSISLEAGSSPSIRHVGPGSGHGVRICVGLGQGPEQGCQGEEAEGGGSGGPSGWQGARAAPRGGTLSCTGELEVGAPCPV